MRTDIISNKNNIQIYKAGRHKQASGVNLIEVMAVTAILTITVVGTCGYRYYSSQNACWAEKQIAAARRNPKTTNFNRAFVVGRGER